jgi:hypothetical protein
MNDKTNQDHPEDRDDETIERLLRLAGPRAPDIEARVYDRVHREWQATSQQPDGARVYQFVRRAWEKDTAKQRYLRWALPAALAASVVIAVTLFMQPPTSAPDRIVIGAVAKVVGDGRGAALPAIGQPVYAGEVLLLPAQGRGSASESMVSSRCESTRTRRWRSSRKANSGWTRAVCMQIPVTSCTGTGA